MIQSLVKTHAFPGLLAFLIAIQIHKSTHKHDYSRPELLARNRLKKIE